MHLLRFPEPATGMAPKVLQQEWRSLYPCKSSLSRKKVFPSFTEELLWQNLFRNPAEWCDNRRDKVSQNHPDFRHKGTGEPLWLKSRYNPPWVDACLHSLQPGQLSGSAGYGIIRLCEEGNLEMALDALLHMDDKCVELSELVYYSLLKICNKTKSVDYALKVKAHLFQRSKLNGFIGDYLVVTLARCGAVEDSCQVFRSLSKQTVFSWTAIISAYASCGKGREALGMYREMWETGIAPDRFTISCILKALSTRSNLHEGRKIHAYAEKSGFTLDVHVGSTLLSFYGKCSSLLETECLFRGLSVCNIVSWNSMLSAYVEHNEGEKALLTYRQMVAESIGADQRSFVISLQACCSLVQKEGTLWPKNLIAEIGRSFHADLSKQGFTSDVFINNTLISLYTKCGCIQEAENVFCKMSECNITSWNEILAAYLDQGECERVLQLYNFMQSESVGSDEWTLVLVLQACWTLSDNESCPSDSDLRVEIPWLEIGRALHADAEVKNLSSHLYVGNSLVNIYRKCGEVKEAERVFQIMSERDTITWNALLSTYTDHECHQEKAFQLYMQMEVSGQSPDDVTLTCLLQACSGRGSPDYCKIIHFLIVSLGYDFSLLLLNTLIHAYGCCASMVDAEATFFRLATCDVASWNALIAGHALNGNCLGSLQCFQVMQNSCTKPDGITFVSLIFACSHAGLVDLAFEFLSLMGNCGLAIEKKHFGSLLDLLGRAGDFHDLESILWRMPLHPDATLWSSLLGACHLHNHLLLAKEAFCIAVLEQPEETNPFILMGNIYAKSELHQA
ncbi:hypothetical protein KP509_09G038200 [Ceratopteris richardii]|uniref:Uncharacterized protein n=1 Tax=Ceratopteris richardii TaxID=49495 RepID=A0A8T2U3I1_CERRI|nr:hypothetical protein KP509_09G038200 [Ceratopteris richardii]